MKAIALALPLSVFLASVPCLADAGHEEAGKPAPEAPAAQPIATEQPAPAPQPAPAEEKKAAEHPRRYGALAVLGLGSAFLGVVGVVLGGVTFMGPALVGTGWAPVNANADGLPIPGTGQSVNPFAALGAVSVVGGLLFGAAGAAMLALEVYLNDGF